MSWSFRQMSRGEISANPIAGEFFTPEGLADALVREAVQNSLDARTGEGPVKVRFYSSGDGGAIPPAKAKKYLKGLWPHLKAVEGGRPNLPTPAQSMAFLLIEDFGTGGLRGSTEQDSDQEADSSGRHDFFYFWRNIGRSQKQDTERGRWGLGKTVFPATSLINSFFGLTIRPADPHSYLMGQAVLKIHRDGEGQYCPYGFFANVSDDGFQRPFYDPETIDEFRKDFNLSRDSQTGLSIVVPFPDAEEIETEQMARSAVLHYFFPILRRELVVEVVGDGKQWLIDSESIDEVVSQIDWAETGNSEGQLRKLFDFVRRIMAVDEKERLKLTEPTPHRAPEWSKGRFDEQIVAAMKQEFADKQMLAIRVPLTVKPKGAKSLRPTFFDVFLEQDDTLLRAEDHYIRQGITVSKIQMLKEKGFRGVVVVTDPALSTLLGDSENPAHTEWLEKATKLKERYDWGPYTVRFVRSALHRIVAQLLFVPEGRDEQLLKNIFYLEEKDEEGPQKAKKKKHGDAPEDDDDDNSVPPSTGSSINVQRVDGGFRLVRHNREVPRPLEVVIDTGYEVRRGNPFKKYEELDFQLDKDPITITAADADVRAEKNRLIVLPTGDDFLIEVTGFDSKRDLAIRSIP